jgi:hypothetical protein
MFAGFKRLLFPTWAPERHDAIPSGLLLDFSVAT